MRSFLTRHSWLLLVFIVALALAGPISTAFCKFICVLVVPAFMVTYRLELGDWWRKHAPERHYIKGILLFALYFVILVAIWSCLPNKCGYKPSYSIVEEMLFACVFLPLLAWVLGVGVTQKAFERAIVLFGLGTALCGAFLLFAYFDISQLLRSPSAFFLQVLDCRFLGCEGKISQLSIFLKDYSFYPTLGSLLLIPLVLKYKGVARWLLIFLSTFNAMLLMLTINRGTIVGFCIALVLMAVYFTRKFAWRKKLIVLLSVLVVMVLVALVLPQDIKVRFFEMASEGEAFLTEGHNSGSVSIRLTIWKVLLSHVKEFWLFGEGPLYATSHLRAYLVEAGYQNYVDAGFIYHNQYLAYFHSGGILGLLFLLFTLFYPLYAMLRSRRLSIAVVSIIVVFAIALMEDRYLGKDGVVALLFLLYFGFFQVDRWRCIENRDKAE